MLLDPTMSLRARWCGFMALLFVSCCCADTASILSRSNHNNHNNHNNNNDNSNSNNNQQQQQQQHFRLSQEQRDQFTRDGYVIVRQALTASQIQALQTASQQTTALHLLSRSKQPSSAGSYFSINQRGVMFGTGQDDATTFESQLQSSGATRNHTSQQEHVYTKVVLADNNKNTKNTKNTTISNNHHNRITDAFRRVALFSDLPQMAAELMHLDARHQNMRILRDIFLAKPVQMIDEKNCDWHVDDMGFWPESFVSQASQETGLDQNGINVWISMADLSNAAQYGGSMAVVPGSHRASWRSDAYVALGQNRSIDGGMSRTEIAAAMQQAVTTGTYLTCDLNRTSPVLRAQMETASHVLQVQPGDVVLATRLLFHKTVAVTPAGVEYYAQQQEQQQQQHHANDNNVLALPLTLNRYSIRYVPGTARLPKGWSVEWPVLEEDEETDEDENEEQHRRITGQSLNDITSITAPTFAFYPQVWPEVDASIDQLNAMGTHMAEWTQRAQAEVMATMFGGGSGGVLAPRTTTATTTNNNNSNSNGHRHPSSTTITASTSAMMSSSSLG